MNPGGSRFLHALRACWNAGEFGLSTEPFAIPSMVSWPDALGSGKLLTPLARMHWENFTACSDLAVVAGRAAGRGRRVLDPHALIRATIATRATSASGRSVLFMMDRRSIRRL